MDVPLWRWTCSFLQGERPGVHQAVATKVSKPFVFPHPTRMTVVLPAEHSHLPSACTRADAPGQAQDAPGGAPTPGEEGRDALASQLS